ncbi:hypothetical protein [Streptomyces xanthophaeus]
MIQLADGWDLVRIEAAHLRSGFARVFTGSARCVPRGRTVLPGLPVDRPDRPAVLEVAAALWFEGHDLASDGGEVPNRRRWAASR